MPANRHFLRPEKCGIFGPMTKLAVLAVMATSLLAPAFAHADDSIASIRDPKRDYVLGGDVVTVWEDSFLFDDGTGKIIVDVRPYTTRGIGIAGRDYVELTGHLSAPGVLTPIVLQDGRSASPVLFSGTSMLEPLSLTEVMRNTVRYRLPHDELPVADEDSQQDNPSSQTQAASAQSAAGNAAQAAAAPADQTANVNQAINEAYREYAARLGDNALPPPNLSTSGNGSSGQSAYSSGSTGASPVSAAQPVGAGGGNAATPPGTTATPSGTAPNSR